MTHCELKLSYRTIRVIISFTHYLLTSPFNYASLGCIVSYHLSSDRSWPILESNDRVYAEFVVSVDHNVCAVRYALSFIPLLSESKFAYAICQAHFILTN